MTTNEEILFELKSQTRLLREIRRILQEKELREFREIIMENKK